MALGEVQQVSNQDAIFQTFLDKSISDIVDLKAPTWKKVKAAAKTVGTTQKGRDKAVLSDVRTNFKAGPSNMDYPVGTVFKRERLKSVPVDQVVTYEIDRATYDDYQNGNPTCLVSMAEETDLLMRAFAERKEFWLAGTGSGKLGTLAAGSTTTVLNLDTVSNGTPAKAYGVSQLKPQVAYDLYTSADVLSASNLEIIEGGVDYTNNQVTLSAALGGAPAVGAYLVPNGSWFNLPHGFAYLFQGGKTGYWEGLTVTNRQEYQTPFVNAAGNEISNIYIERALQKQAFRTGLGLNKTFKIFASPTQISVYKAGGWNMFRFASKDDTYNTAFKNARYEDSVFEPFPKADPDTFYGVDMSDLIYIEQTKMGPFKGADGLMFNRKQGSGQHGKGEFFMQYGVSDNFTIDHPELHMVVRNLQATATEVTIWNFTSTT